MWWWSVLAVLMLVAGVGLITWWALDTRAARAPQREAGFRSNEQIRGIDEQYRA